MNFARLCERLQKSFEGLETAAPGQPTPAAEVGLPLEFLGHSSYVAEIYADAADAGDHPKHTAISQQRVTPATVLHLKPGSGGGGAIRFREE